MIICHHSQPLLSIIHPYQPSLAITISPASAKLCLDFHHSQPLTFINHHYSATQPSLHQSESFGMPSFHGSDHPTATAPHQLSAATCTYLPPPQSFLSGAPGSLAQVAAQASLDLQLVFEADGVGAALQAAERAEQLELHQVAPRRGEGVRSMVDEVCQIHGGQILRDNSMIYDSRGEFMLISI